MNEINEPQLINKITTKTVVMSVFAQFKVDDNVYIIKANAYFW